MNLFIDLEQYVQTNPQMAQGILDAGLLTNQGELVLETIPANAAL